MKTGMLMLIFLLFVGLQRSDGQRMGFTAGVNLANLQYNDGDLDFEPEDFLLLHLGLTVEGQLLGGLYCNTGLFYTEKGYKYDIPGITEDEFFVGWNKYQYLEVPLNLKIKSLLAKRTFLFIQGGPYAGYAIWGRNYWDGETRDIDFDRSGLSRYDYGIGVGAGLELGNVVIGFNYQKGYANIREKIGQDVKNRLYQISITFMDGNK